MSTTAINNNDTDGTEGGGDSPDLIGEAPAPIACRIYTIAAAADLLSVNAKTIYRMIEDGELRKVYIRRRTGVRDDDLAEYIDNHTAG